MPFDFEHKATRILAKRKQLKIGIVGFGKFGQFLAQRLVQAGHQVLATSRTDYREVAAGMGVAYFADANDFCEEHPEVVIFASSILSMESVLAALPVQRLKRNTLFVDVLSVKEFPKRLMLSILPPEVDILCTHPMFGPDSGKASWQGLNFMYERVRIASSPSRQQRAANLLKFFESEGCRMVEMSCEEHDRIAASTQFITHTVGRILGSMDLAPTPIDTRGFQSLLNLVDNTTHDSFDLYYGLFMYNANATEEVERLEHAFDSVKKQLFRRLHDVARDQLFQQAPAAPPKRLMLGAGSHVSPDESSNGASASQREQSEGVRL
ncbi:probable T-protein [Coccomyxa sp. Obi]|nr:probable T-protein [Coccomyxa sp. Obi]